ncbi:MAG: molybdopterin molybdotransferase [Archaeoglobi archaeon]|nr:molybdopterin biosynthesis protein [Candidatus Mnemosynella bozhongmuii]MDI3502256.1 molybdopterin molybdotransferase [Archaeoglobi archaeon]MDK2781954.1 molybdopterin molybdotransferase [Archaeoglobi archaeon]
MSRYRRLISVEEARKILSSLKIKPDEEVVPLPEALGRVSATSVQSKIDVPPFERASMDGFAVISSDTFEAREDKPVILKIVGKISPGERAEIRIASGEAVEIATGAMMPEGADAVVMLEDTVVEGSSVKVLRPVKRFENVMGSGADISAGERILKKYTLISPHHIGVLSATGIKELRVLSLKAGIISTGNELQDLGEELSEGKIYDVNRYSISSSLRSIGCTPVDYGIVEDDERRIEETILRASEECHVVITSGSTSVGVSDLLPKIIERNGEILFHGVNISPGKPFIAGKINGKAIFSLPGYPTSALSIYLYFVEPLLRRAMHLKEESRKVRMKLASKMRFDGRRMILPVGVFREKCYPVFKSSGAITSLSEAEGFAEIPETTEVLDEGAELEVTLFPGKRIPDALFMGSHCPGVEILDELMEHEMKIVNLGSTGGLVAMRRGIPDIAGIHLGDNLESARKYGLKNCVLVKGYLREQGIISSSEISSFEEILERGLRIVNRNPGSGTRILLERLIEEEAVKRGVDAEEIRRNMRGYDVVVKTHSSLAYYISTGRADAGIGLRYVAEQYGLFFTPISSEEYDFLIQKDRLEEPAVQEFLEVLRSREFSESLPAGIKTYEKTGEIIEIE